jgi:hypothetical protein
MHTVIVVDEGEELRIVTQPDHARFAAELLSLWRRDGLPDHPRRDQLLFAVREHDNGWREADAAPRVDPTTQRLYDFTDFPEADRREVWMRGIMRFAESRPYVALLVAEHAQRLHRHRRPGWSELLEQITTLRHEWLHRAGLEPAQVRDDYRYLNLADALSLAYCTGTRKPLEHHCLTAVVEGDTLRLEPFPLAGATTFQIPARRIANRPYASDFQAASALARARWDRFPARVMPF